MPTITEKFRASNAWQIMRQKEHYSWHYKLLWSKGVPIKISFFLWRLWKFKLPVDEVLARCGFDIVSICRCCLQPQQETIHIYYLQATLLPVFGDILLLFTTATGVQGPVVQVQQAVVQWWNTMCATKLKPIF